MLLTAHSGSDGTPENSRLFIEIMSELSVSCVEVDVRKKRSELYLSHDSMEIIDECLTLFEAFQIISERSELSINCDLKESHLENEVIDLAKQFHIEDKLILSGTVDVKSVPLSFNKEKLFYNPENVITDFYSEFPLRENQLNKLVDYCKENGIKIININYKMATESFVRRMNREQIGLSIWTVDDFQSIDFFKVNNIHNVTSKAACGYLYYQKKRRA